MPCSVCPVLVFIEQLLKTYFEVQQRPNEDLLKVPSHTTFMFSAVVSKDFILGIIHNLIKNIFYLSIMAVLDKDDLRPKRMTLSDFLSSTKTLLRFSQIKVRYPTSMN